MKLHSRGSSIVISFTSVTSEIFTSDFSSAYEHGHFTAWLETIIKKFKKYILSSKS